MRKAQKEQAEKLVCLLDRVHDGIKMSIETGQKDQALDFLGQCQSGAINLGEAIEETEGEGFVTVKHLEEYCETVYQIYEKLRQEQSVSANQAFKGLRRSLTQVKNSIRNDIHVRTEVVFLPYKASMWDSLESVWKAAEEDPECDAYVIPIPYYDRNPDGSFREEHYEGSLYPEYVPVTSYQDYDFEEHRPDVVFIHNPYDECNYVTSVHPFFYARNLKQYTDKLVYIPYFILNEIDPENAAAVKGIEHFCTVPGVIYADKVIVQSENMRQAYVNVMSEFAEENSLEGMDRKYWEEKILGLGSPKVDKVLNTRREDLEIPKEWLRIIEKPDGSWKKIIFYNTSVTTLLQYSEHYLEKMKDVFRVFYENREDVALLWRPHPLIKATIESMRPELWSEYQKMAEAYRKDGWGIYDDTADIDRAVAICDAYYGDYSSVVRLCQEAGKLVMVQDSKRYLREDKIYKGKKHINLSSAIKIDETIWFYPYYFNRLFAMEIKTGKLKYYDIPVSAETNCEGGNFCSMVHIGHKIYLLPFHAKEILQFDILSQKFTSISINPVWPRNNEEKLFMGTGIYEKYLFVMGVCVPVIIRIDTVDNSVEYITDWVEKVKGIVFNRKDAFFRKQSVVLDDKLFVSFCNANAVLEINCRTLETIIHQMGTEKEGYSGICFSKSNMWICPRYHRRLVRWNIETNEVQKIELPEHKNGDYSYTGILCQDDKKILLHGTEGLGVTVDKENGIFEQEGNCELFQNDDDVFIYYENRSGSLSLYNRVDKSVETINLEIEEKYLKKDYHIFDKGNVIVTECNEVNILFLLETLLQKRGVSETDRYVKSYGEIIYNQLI